MVFINYPPLINHPFYQHHRLNTTQGCIPMMFRFLCSRFLTCSRLYPLDCISTCVSRLSDEIDQCIHRWMVQLLLKWISKPEHYSKRLDLIVSMLIVRERWVDSREILCYMCSGLKLFKVRYARFLMYYISERESVFYTMILHCFYDSRDDFPLMLSLGNISDWLTRSITTKTFCPLLHFRTS